MPTLSQPSPASQPSPDPENERLVQIAAQRTGTDPEVWRGSSQEDLLRAASYKAKADKPADQGGYDTESSSENHPGMLGKIGNAVMSKIAGSDTLSGIAKGIGAMWGGAANTVVPDQYMPEGVKSAMQEHPGLSGVGKAGALTVGTALGEEGLSAAGGAISEAFPAAGKVISRVSSALEPVAAQAPQEVAGVAQKVAPGMMDYAKAAGGNFLRGTAKAATPLFLAGAAQNPQTQENQSYAQPWERLKSGAEMASGAPIAGALSAASTMLPAYNKLPIPKFIKEAIGPKVSGSGVPESQTEFYSQHAPDIERKAQMLQTDPEAAQAEMDAKKEGVVSGAKHNAQQAEANRMGIAEKTEGKIPIKVSDYDGASPEVKAHLQELQNSRQAPESMATETGAKGTPAEGEPTRVLKQDDLPDDLELNPVEATNLHRTANQTYTRNTPFGPAKVANETDQQLARHLKENLTGGNPESESAQALGDQADTIEKKKLLTKTSAEKISTAKPTTKNARLRAAQQSVGESFGGGLDEEERIKWDLANKINAKNASPQSAKYRQSIISQQKLINYLKTLKSTNTAPGAAPAADALQQFMSNKTSDQGNP